MKPKPVENLRHNRLKIGAATQAAPLFSVSGGLLSALCIFFTSGCSPPSSTDEAPLQSRFFSHVKRLGARGTGLGQFNKPRSVAVDREDNIFVADMTGRVQKFSPEGQFLACWEMEQTDKGKPKGMGLDQNGDVIVVEPHYSRINHFAPDGRLVFQWGRHGTNIGELAFPRAVAVNRRGEIYVSEYGLVDRVQRFSSNGSSCLGGFGQAGAQPGGFNRPEGLGVDLADQVYVADSCNHRIQVFSAQGAFLRAFGRPGAAPGQLSYPYDVQVDNHGYQYVCEFGNSRIQIFDTTGASLEIIGGPGDALDRLSNPWSIALDSHGNLYVADSGNHRVLKYIRTRSHEI